MEDAKDNSKQVTEEGIFIVKDYKENVTDILCSEAQVSTLTVEEFCDDIIMRAGWMRRRTY